VRRRISALSAAAIVRLNRPMGRFLAAGTVILVLGGCVALAASGGGEDLKPKPTASRPTRPAPPKPMRKLFPRYRVVAFYGAPQDKELGTLGIGTPDAMANRLRKAARPYRRAGRPIMPAFELIAVVASGAPGNDGSYSYRQKRTVIDTYLKAARRAKALLVLDIQPGHSDFMTEVKRLEPYLEQPDVALALDPEWHVGRGQIPGKVIGSVNARDVNRISSYIARIVRKGNLPQKLLLIHQFTESMIRNKASLKKHSELALTINVDGFGDPPNKVAKYGEFADDSKRFHKGFKLFYEEDTDLMSPRAVLRLRPRPEVIVYE
jgi:hypothetical protein